MMGETQTRGSLRRPGALDSLTVLRYTHNFEDGGGVEEYLRDLNGVLLRRNRMAIIQLTMPRDSCQGNRLPSDGLMTVPLRWEVLNRADGTSFSGPHAISRAILKFFAVLCCHAPRLIRLNWLFRCFEQGVSYDREPVGLRPVLSQLFDTYKVGLVVMHLAGGRGGAEILKFARKRGIPVLIQNHFSNHWLFRPGMVLQCSQAASVGAVSRIGVPDYLKPKFVWLGDGIDTNFFSPIDSRQNEPVTNSLLLPARIVEGKGHCDLIRAMRRLRASGIDCRATLVGRIDSRTMLSKIEQLLAEYDLSSQVRIKGPLSRASLRDLYRSSSVVVLPSYSEGLGRVLLEAAAVEMPVIVYDSGGTSEAVIDNVTGYLVPRGNVERLADRIGELLTNKRLADRFGKAGRSFVCSHFTLEKLAERHEAWYAKALP